MVKVGAKLKASTIMESVVAMIMIVACLSIGTMIFVNVLNSDKDRTELKAMLLLNSESAKVRELKKYLDAEDKVGDCTVKRTFEKYKEADNLLWMKLKVVGEEGKVLFERNELLLIE